MTTTNDLPRFKIRPPLTTGDKGAPSKSIWKDAERVFALIEDERHLVAHELFKNVKSRLEAWEEKNKQQQSRGSGGMRILRGSQKTSLEQKEREEFIKTIEFLEMKKAAIDKLEVRVSTTATTTTTYRYSIHSNK